MAHLAIQGHATRGNEVIALLEMLGGIDSGFFSGNETDRFYYIEVDKGICFIDSVVEHLDFCKLTLEQFLERYPYKVGDRVANVYGASGKVYVMKWIDDEIQYRLNFGHHTSGWYGADELQPIEEKESMETAKITITLQHHWNKDKIELDVTKDYEIKEENGKYYVVKKQLQYPKTFIEVLNFWHPNRQLEDDYQRCYKKDLIEKFQDLLYARDAYWKIAGMEMGLGKSWKPDWNNISDKHCIYVVGMEMWLKECQTRQCNLAFPTAKIRDAFYENFKDLIEQCKELL